MPITHPEQVVDFTLIYTNKSFLISKCLFGLYSKKFRENISKYQSYLDLTEKETSIDSFGEFVKACQGKYYDITISNCFDLLTFCTKWDVKVVKNEVDSYISSFTDTSIIINKLKSYIQNKDNESDIQSTIIDEIEDIISQKINFYLNDPLFPELPVKNLGNIIKKSILLNNQTESSKNSIIIDHHLFHTFFISALTHHKEESLTLIDLIEDYGQFTSSEISNLFKYSVFCKKTAFKEDFKKFIMITDEQMKQIRGLKEKMILKQEKNNEKLSELKKEISALNRKVPPHSRLISLSFTVPPSFSNLMFKRKNTNSIDEEIFEVIKVNESSSTKNIYKSNNNNNNIILIDQNLKINNNIIENNNNKNNIIKKQSKIDNNNNTTIFRIDQNSKIENNNNINIAKKQSKINNNNNANIIIVDQNMKGNKNIISKNAIYIKNDQDTFNQNSFNLQPKQKVKSSKKKVVVINNNSMYNGGYFNESKFIQRIMNDDDLLQSSIDEIDDDGTTTIRFENKNARTILVPFKNRFTRYLYRLRKKMEKTQRIIKANFSDMNNFYAQMEAFINKIQNDPSCYTQLENSVVKAYTLYIKKTDENIPNLILKGSRREAQSDNDDDADKESDYMKVQRFLNENEGEIKKPRRRFGKKNKDSDTKSKKVVSHARGWHKRRNSFNFQEPKPQVSSIYSVPNLIQKYLDDDFDLSEMEANDTSENATFLTSKSSSSISINSLTFNQNKSNKKTSNDSSPNSSQSTSTNNSTYNSNNKLNKINDNNTNSSQNTSTSSSTIKRDASNDSCVCNEDEDDWQVSPVNSNATSPSSTKVKRKPVTVYMKSSNPPLSPSPVPQNLSNVIKVPYDQNLDKFNGILNFSLQNLPQSLMFKVYVSSSGVKADPSVICSKDNTTMWVSGNMLNDWILFDFRKASVRLSHYSLQTIPNPPQHGHLKNWNIEGTNAVGYKLDDVKKNHQKIQWEIIDRKEDNQTLNRMNEKAVFQVKHDDFFEYLRLRITGPNHEGTYKIQLKKIEFFGQLNLGKF